MTFVEIIAFGGWLVALIQFIATHAEGKKKNEEEMLEKTLSYFERGTQARSIGISLVDAVWFKRKKYLEVIVPVLVSQVKFLLTDAEDYGQEQRNLIRLFILLEKCLPYATDSQHESMELSDAILTAAMTPGKLNMWTGTLKFWYAKFNNGDVGMFEAEVEGS